MRGMRTRTRPRRRGHAKEACSHRDHGHERPDPSMDRGGRCLRR
jgi:hypothetical protein